MKKSGPRGPKSEERIEEGSGNVFADLGFENPDEEILRAELVRHLHHEIERRGLTQAKAAKLLGIDQPEVSRLLRGRLERFSLERIIRFLMASGRDIRIVLPPPVQRGKGKMGRLFIEAA